MTKYLQKCKECKRYGLTNPESKCQYCGGQLINTNPPKFSLVDKFAKYRLDYFKDEFKNKFGE